MSGKRSRYKQDIFDAVLGLWREHVHRGEIPTSARFIFYEAEQRGIISKKPGAGAPAREQRNPSINVQAALTYWREQGVIPWDHIVDETRTLENYTGHESIAAGMTALAAQVRLDPWQGEAPVILTESRSLSGVLRPVAGRYCVPIAATNGQASGFLHTDIGPLLRVASRVIYLGDLDLSGSHIEANTKTILSDIAIGNTDPAQVVERDRLLDDPDAFLRWERLAITQEQVDASNPRIDPIEKVDARFKGGRGTHYAYETEALQQGVLVRMLTAHLDGLLPVPLKDVLVQESAERAAMLQKVGTP